jgi:hypothetical protein
MKKETVSIDDLRQRHVYPFVDEPRPMEELRRSKAYVLWEKSVTDPKSLTRLEKDWLAKEFIDSMGLPNAISVGGWRIVFPTAKKYLLQDQYDMREYRVYYGFDRASVRHATYNTRGEIVEHGKTWK